MTYELGEIREAMAQGCWNMVEDFANSMKSEDKPFYIVFFAKPDNSVNGIRQAIKAYYKRPAKLLGILVWYVNHPMGIFQFVPELSSPPDIPLDPTLLSDRSEDQFSSIAGKGKELGVQ